MKIDLGYKDPYSNLPVPAAGAGDTPEAVEEKPTIYPIATLRGEAATQCAAAHEVDETFTATAEFRVASKSSRKKNQYSEGGDEVELELISIDKGDSAPAVPEETAEGALDAYRESKAAPVESEMD